MVNPTPGPQRLPRLSFLSPVLLVLVAAQLGCRNAAYSDLYVESMAAEIRQLEDQLYEYDNEYHVLEQELANLKAENQQLRQTPAAAAKPQTGFGQLLAPKTGANPSLDFSSRDDVLEPPASRPPTGRPPASEPLPPKIPQSILEAPAAESALPPASPPQDSLPKPSPPKKEELPNDLLDLPTIEPGTPMPPAMPVLKDLSSDSSQPNSRSQAGPTNQLELNLSRIEVPNQLASASSDRALLKLGTEKPADMRIVELAFHPTLTRAANFDDESDDDGLYLVLQPKNVQGQLVPTFADLEIAALDPAREGNSDAARIARWSYSANEVKSKFQPIGTNQGIHLTLPWNGPDPLADRVIVFVRYTLPDGRQVVNDKTIFVSGKGNMKTVWVPRSTDASAVVTASGEQPASSNPKNVVRPQGSTNEPAPRPAPR